MTPFPTTRLLCPARLVAALAALLLGSFAQAHPLGQNAFNREAAIIVAPDQVRIEYLLDLAEIPTLAAGSEADADHDGQIGEAEWAAHAQRWAQALPGSLFLAADGRRLALELSSQDWVLSPGESGLSTLRLLARMTAPWPLRAEGTTLAYRDDSAERLGWKEVSISAAEGVQLRSSDAPAQSRTRSMTDFTPRPEGPPALRTAAAEAVLAAPDGSAAATPVRLDIGAKAGAARPLQTAQSPRIWSFFKLGVHHIAIGWDHLVFLLGLVLLSASLRRLALTVTAFTVAHSITLALASQGLVQPPGNWVEALIAATIAYVGLVALRTRKTGHGPGLAFGFGLVHGFGFAGALADSTGADQQLNLLGLLSFNLGIECFQLLLICAVVPVLNAFQRRAWYPGLHQALAGAVFLAGTFWLLERSLGDAQQALIAVLAATLVLAGIRWYSTRGPRSPRRTRDQMRLQD